MRLTMGNDGHVTDVGDLVHKGSDLESSVLAFMRHFFWEKAEGHTSSTVKLLHTDGQQGFGT